MWSGQPPPSGLAPQQQAPSAGQQQSSQQKHDIFVGNLAFNTTEDQLMQVFSEVGRVIKVRMVTDIETGKPRGFAFVEFQDPQAALSAIRNMNDYELNGRRIRVNFSNSSHLETLAGKLGMDIPNNNPNAMGGASSTSTNNNASSNAGPGTQAVADALKNMSKGEMYDVLQKLKEVADRDADEARRILSCHPQLPEAILFCMSKLDMVQQNAASAGSGGMMMPPPSAAAASSVTRNSVTGASSAGSAAASMRDPRQRIADPRQRAADPRARMGGAGGGGGGALPPPPPPPPRPGGSNAFSGAQSQPPPPPYGAGVPMQGGGGALDPALVQQVMSLTPQQIAQLPPDKQQSILEYRHQITTARGAR